MNGSIKMAKSTKRKKQYMKKYNQRKDVKSKKADYMRKVRSEEEKDASRKLVELFLEFGFEDLAYETAMERAPEMLATVQSKARKPK